MAILFEIFLICAIGYLLGNHFKAIIKGILILFTLFVGVIVLLFTTVFLLSQHIQ